MSAFRDPRLYALNVFADQFSRSVQPLVPSRLFISNAGGTPGDGQGGGSVLETLLNLILSEKAGINLQQNTGSSKPMEDFIRQFTGSGSAGNGDPCGSEIRSQTSDVRGQVTGDGRQINDSGSASANRSEWVNEKE